MKKKPPLLEDACNLLPESPNYRDLGPGNLEGETPRSTNPDRVQQDLRLLKSKISARAHSAGTEGITTFKPPYERRPPTDLAQHAAAQRARISGARSSGYGQAAAGDRPQWGTRAEPAASEPVQHIGPTEWNRASAENRHFNKSGG